MAKKTKKTVTSKKVSTVRTREGSRIQFLRDLYSKYPNVSNQEALNRLLAKFPESNANVRAICTWKTMLRHEGINIPVQATRSAESSKKVSKAPKLKKGKK